MRYWNPKKAAARRIALDAIARYIPVGGEEAAVAGAEARRTPEGRELGARLAKLKETNPGMFKLVASEFAKEGKKVDGGGSAP